MIIKFWERQEVRNQLLATGAKYANVIGRNIDNPADLWTHIGNGFWIGCWHPGARDPRIPRGVGGRQVLEQFLPPKVFTPHGNGVAGGNSGVPHIRLVKTITSHPTKASMIGKDDFLTLMESVGWMGGNRGDLGKNPLVGMIMRAERPESSHEFELWSPYENQASVARFESGESGGPSFGFNSAGESFLQGIHRGPGGPKGDTWIAGVDVWLGHPQIRDWIMGIIGEQVIEAPSVEVEPEKVVRVCVPKGFRVIVEEVE